MNDSAKAFNYFKKVLGQPYLESKNFLLFNADMLSSLENIKAKLIDLTVTSPPYNIGKEYEKVRPINEYVAWSKKWIGQVYKVTKKNGAFVLNLGYISIERKGHAVPLPYLLWNKTKFYLNQEIVWNYGAGVAASKYLSPRNEKLLWYVKDMNNYTFNLDEIRDPDIKYPNQKKNGKIRVNSIGKNPSDVWMVAKVTSGKDRASSERTPHPAQFPVDLIERAIKGFSNPGDIIMDPFMGSGTVAEVALANRRKVIGFEVNSNYCELIRERVNRLLFNNDLLTLEI